MKENARCANELIECLAIWGRSLPDAKETIAVMQRVIEKHDDLSWQIFKKVAGKQ